MRPDWELLASWVAVVAAGSVSEAAHVLGISQAAVSQRVRKLESILGTPLLDRTTRPAQPTFAGRHLFEHAKDLLVRGERMVEHVRSA
jgi:DNA-binding transcriptional LysR family regulator